MTRFLSPREHGTYAQLVFPILSGLLLGSVGWPALALAAAVISAYLAYEPVAVLTGMRGVRLQRERAGAARRQLAVLAPAGVLLGAGGLVASPPGVRLLLLLPAGIAVLLLPLIWFRAVKSLAGESLVAAALSSVHVPLAALGGAHGPVLWGPGLAWFAGFFAATLAVHSIKARPKRRQRLLVTVALLLPAGALLAAVVVAAAVPAVRVIAAMLSVLLAAVVGVNLARVHPRSLKRVGWTLVAANTAALAVLTLL